MENLENKEKRTSRWFYETWEMEYFINIIHCLILNRN